MSRNFEHYISSRVDIYVNKFNKPDKPISEVPGKLLLGRFLLGQSTTYKAGTTGGAATHTLNVNQLPNHKHLFYNDAGGWVYPTVDRSHSTNWGGSWSTSNDYKIALATDQKMDSSSYSQPIKHMPPYLSVYIWKRTK